MTDPKARPAFSSASFQAIQLWKDGLNEKDYDKLKSALDAGIPVGTEVENNHPLFILLGDMMDYDKIDPERKDQDDVPGQAFNENLEQIIDLLMDRGMDLLAPMKSDNGKVIDHIVFFVDSVTGAKLTFEAIMQAKMRGNAFEYDLNGLLERHTAEGKDPILLYHNRESFYSMMSALRETHEYTRIALKSCLGQAVEDLSDENKADFGFWLNDFPFPTDDFMKETFPVTQDEYDDAVDAADREEAKKSMLLQKEVEDGDGSGADISKVIKTLEKEHPAEILRELDQFIGLEDFKQSMQSLVLRIQYDNAREMQALKVDGQNYHTAFLGNPGTGKTTCARIKARLLHSLGKTGPRYAELSRDDIVGNYVGQTENKLKDILDNVDTVFIDEAYALSDGGEGDTQDFGRRALDVLVARLGNEKDPLSLFVAGYTEPMKKFVEANPGLKSRIKVFERMEDFSMDELGKILDINLEKRQYTIDDDARALILDALEAEKTNAKTKKHFGNAREVVNIVQDLPNHIASRLAAESNGVLEKFNAAVLMRITKADAEKALKTRQAPGAKKRADIGFSVPKAPTATSAVKTA